MQRCLFLVFVLVSFGVSPALAEGKPRLTVGALLSFTGGLEQWCGHIKQGIELAAKEEARVEVIVKFEDDHSVDKKAALSAANKLVNLDRVDLLYSWTASMVSVLAPIATTARVPLLIGAHDRRVKDAGPYVFGAFVNYDLVPREIARFLIQKRSARKLALIMAADDWSQGFDRPFREEVTRLGGRLVLTETIGADEKDVSSLVLKLKRQGVHAVLAPLFSTSLYSFLKQSSVMHFFGIIHVGDGMFEEDIRMAGASAEGVYASQIWLNSPELRAKVTKHKDDSQVNDLQLGLVASGYDWVKHLQAAGAHIVDSGRPLNRNTIKETLATFGSQGFLGPQMYGEAPVKSGEISVVVKEGRFVPAI